MKRILRSRKGHPDETSAIGGGHGAGAVRTHGGPQHVGGVRGRGDGDRARDIILRKTIRHACRRLPQAPARRAGWSNPIVTQRLAVAIVIVIFTIPRNVKGPSWSPGA